MWIFWFWSFNDNRCQVTNKLHVATMLKQLLSDTFITKIRLTNSCFFVNILNLFQGYCYNGVWVSGDEDDALKNERIFRKECRKTKRNVKFCFFQILDYEQKNNILKQRFPTWGTWRISGGMRLIFISFRFTLRFLVKMP